MWWQGRTASTFSARRGFVHICRQRVIDDIRSTPRDGRLARLLGCRVGPGFRSSVGKLLPGEAQRASRLHLLLDDWVGAALVSGYSVQHAAIILGIEEKLPAGTADRMAGICAGFAPEASLIGYARRNDTIPSVHGPVAPPLAGLHPVDPLRAHGMRRFRRLDLHPRRRIPRISMPTSATHTSTATVSRRSCTSTPSPARWIRRREPSPRSRRRCGCCRGRSAPAPSAAPRGFAE